MNMKSKKDRLSNIELLRMVAMFLVLIVHADYYSLGAPTFDEIQQEPTDTFFRILFEAISIVCVNVFVLISGWFGIRPTLKGLCNFLFQSIFFLTGLYIVTLLIGTSQLSLKGLAGCIFATKLNWFIKAYLLLYILVPVLNAFIETASRRVFKSVLIGFFIFTCTYGWSEAADFMQRGYTTLFFIGLYLLARYIRIYTPKWASYKASTDLMIYIGTVLFVTLTTFLLPHLFNRAFTRFFTYVSPTTIIGAVYLLLCFTKLKFHNRFVNWCGVSCFAVFLVHVSPSTLPYFKKLFRYLHEQFSTLEFWTITIIALSVIFILSILIDKVRIKAWNYISKKFEPLLNKNIFND